MEKEITLNESVKEAIEIAFLKLIQKKDVKKVTVTELTETAGVGRSSFYRNFESFEDIAISRINRIYREYFAEKPVNPNIYNKGNFDYFLVDRFRFVKKNAEFFLALHKNGMLYSVMKKMDSEITKKFFVADISESKYFNAMIMSLSVGVIEEWVAGGMKESEEEMAEIVKACLFGAVENLKRAFE